MKQHRAKIVIILLLALIVGVPFLLRPAATEGTGAATSERLIVITPHNEQIRYEIARAFNLHRVEHGQPPVTFDWRSSGGTSDLRRQVLTQFAALAQRGLEDQGIGIDLFFGGGEFEHNVLAKGVSTQRDGEEVRISTTLPIPVPAELLAAAFPEPTIGGERLYHEDLHWVGVVLASFGIVYNNDVVAMLEAPTPRTWGDLTAPPYAGWIALADPGHSGSIAATYEAILRRSGWTEGWALLRRTFANARYFTSSASKVPVDVSAGEAAAGMCIDFYGRFQAGAVGGGRVGYVDPPGMTAITADPISILRGAPHRELAEEFVLWLLTPEAQSLWQRRIGTPGGPDRFELRRQPIRRDLYTDEERSYWADPGITPFEDARPYPAGTPFYYSLVAPVAHAIAIDIHQDLVEARQALLMTPRSDPNRSQMLALFDAMPPDLTLTWPDADLATGWQKILDDPQHPRYDEVRQTLADFASHLNALVATADARLDARLRWTLFFRENYRQIVRLAP